MFPDLYPHDSLPVLQVLSGAHVRYTLDFPDVRWPRVRSAWLLAEGRMHAAISHHMRSHVRSQFASRACIPQEEGHIVASFDLDARPGHVFVDTDA